MQSRSLYVNDIQGAQPKRHVYLKESYRAKHNEEILRFARNPEEKRLIDWYVPPKKFKQPMDKLDESIWRTKKSLSHGPSDQIGNLSKSVILPRKNPFSESKLFEDKQKSVLRASGRSSLSSVPKSDHNPYFPHMYADPKLGESNKWTGSKIWQEQSTKIVQLPTIDQCYFKKWY